MIFSKALSMLIAYSSCAEVAAQSLQLVPEDTSFVKQDEDNPHRRHLQTFSATETAVINGENNDKMGMTPSYSSDRLRYTIGSVQKNYCAMFEKQSDGGWTEVQRFDSRGGCCKMSKDGTTLVTLNKVYIKDTITGSWNTANINGSPTMSTAVYSGHTSETYSITPDGSRFVHGRRVNNIPSLAVYHYNSTSAEYELTQILTGGVPIYMTTHFSDDGNRLMAYNYNLGEVWIWDFDGTSWSRTYIVEDSSTTDYTFYNKDMSADGKRLLACRGSTSTKIFDFDETTSTWSIVATIPYGTSDMYACALSPSGNRAVIGRYPIKVFDRDESSSTWIERGALTFSNGLTFTGRAQADFSDYNGNYLALSANVFHINNSENYNGISFFFTLSDQLEIAIDPAGILPTFGPSRIPSLSPTASSQPSSTPTITKSDKNEWFIENTGEATEEVTSSDTILVSLPFNTTNRDIGAAVFEQDCVTPFDKDEYFDVDTTGPTSTISDGFVQFNTTLDTNITAINGTNYWNSFTDGSKGGWFEACVETYLSFTDNLNMGNDDVDQKVTFKNNILNISVSLTATYEVDEVSVIREEASTEDLKTDYSEFIVAYECNVAAPYAEVTGKTYSQGDKITICVSDVSNDIVEVDEFVDLVVTQDGINNYNFITGTLYNPDITTPVCLDATSMQRRLCYVNIRALARFFEIQSLTDLTISGSVNVIRDGRRVRRKLRMALPAAEMTNDESSFGVFDRRIEEEAKEGGQFEMEVSLTSGNDIAVSDGFFGGEATALVSLAIGAAGAALMV